MDDARFDSLVAALAAGRSRRRLLGLLLGGTIPSLIAGPAISARNRRKKKKKKCPFGRPPCGNNCCLLEETCQRGRCKHRCEDGVHNAGETDIDCGRVCDGVLGTSPTGRCQLRKRCAGGEDCRSAFCAEITPGAGKVCVECDGSDNDCQILIEGRPRCLDNFCFECAVDRDCPAQGQPANLDKCVAPLAGGCPRDQPCVCAECRTSDDCPAGTFCDEVNACVDATCGPTQDFCVDGVVGCNGNDQCVCHQTVANLPFCALPGGFVSGCASAASCAASGVGPRAQCVKLTSGSNCGPTSGTICALPCE